MEEKYLNTAINLGNTICRDAFHYKGLCNWIGVTNDITDRKPKPYYSAHNSTWYNGTSGIAWFLAQLYSISGDKIHQKIALGAITQSLQMTSGIQFGKLGFHAGITGISFAAIEIGQLLHKDFLVEQGLQLIRKLNQLSENEYNLDVINGCAGVISVMIRLHRKYNDENLMELLIKMGNYLVKESKKEKIGVSWNTMPFGSDANLTGYAHGAAGISLALLELFQYTKEKQFKDIALEGFSYEESCFDTDQKNWPDFRYNNLPGNNAVESRPCGCAWCHGAPGIGLSRFRAYELTQDDLFKNSGQIALDTTIRNFNLKELGNYSLCHGVFGNAELLLYASVILDDLTYVDIVKEMAYEAIDKYYIRNIPFPNGTQSSLNSPNLMLGMAGIGYGFLRLNDIKKFKSILLIY